MLLDFINYFRICRALLNLCHCKVYPLELLSLGNVGKLDHRTANLWKKERLLCCYSSLKEKELHEALSQFKQLPDSEPGSLRYNPDALVSTDKLVGLQEKTHLVRRWRKVSVLSISNRFLR